MNCQFGHVWTPWRHGSEKSITDIGIRATRVNTQRERDTLLRWLLIASRRLTVLGATYGQDISDALHALGWEPFGEQAQRFIERQEKGESDAGR